MMMIYFACLIVLAVTASLPWVQAVGPWAKPAPPVFPLVQVGTLCAEACAGMNISIQVACYDCLTGAGWANPWTRDHQPAYTMARLPLQEAGVEGALAFPFQAPDDENYNVLVKGNYDKEMTFAALLTKNLEICMGPSDNRTCITRNAAPADPTPDASATFGFCWGTPGWLKSVSPNCEGPDPYGGAKPNTPEDLASIIQLGSYNDYEDQMKAYARALFTDVEVAADSVWYGNSNAWSPSLFFYQLTSADKNMLLERFGSDWSPEMTEKLDQGKLIRMDLDTWLTEADMFFEMNENLLLAGPDMVFEKIFNETMNTFVFRCIIIRVADAGRHRLQPEVYTPAKSPTAFIAAMIFARSSILFHNVFAHSVFWHMVSMSQQYVLYNTLDPGVPVNQSTHPMRQLLDEFMEPRLQIALYYGISRNGIGISIDEVIGRKNIHSFRALLVRTGGPLGNSKAPADMYGVVPPGVLERTGLNASEFTSEGGKEWDLWDHANVHMEIWRMCKEYTDEVIPIYYKDSDDVTGDTQLMNLVAGLADPEIGGLGRVISTGTKVETPGELSEFIANMIYSTVIHAFNHFHDYMVKTANAANAASTNMNIPGGAKLPDPNAEYTVDFMMENYLPNTTVIGDFAGVAFLVWGIPPMGGQWVYPVEGSETEVDYNRALPFFENPEVLNKEQVDKSNAAAAKFRRKVIEFSMNYPVGPVRPIDYNYEMPWFWTAVQDV